MKTRKLGNLEVSELGAGCMSISANMGTQRGDPTRWTRPGADPMSATGTKQTYVSTLNMSAFGGKADIPDRLPNVR
jgi:hypothetical protein